MYVHWWVLSKVRTFSTNTMIYPTLASQDHISYI